MDISHTIDDQRNVSGMTAATALLLGFLAGVTAVAGGTIGVLAVVGGGLALALLLLAITVTRGRMVDLLVLGALALMALPLDKYLMYREHVGGWPGLRISAADFALLALIPSAAISLWARRTRNVIPKPVLAIYGLLLGQYVVSAWNAADRGLAAFELASAVHALLTAAVVGAMFRRALLRPALMVMALLVVVHTGIAAAQVVTGRPIGAGLFGGPGVVAETLETGVTRIRASGLFDHPIVYADMLLLSLPIFFAALFIPGGRAWRGSMIAALLVGAVGLALSLSRGAWISACVAGAVMFALMWRYELWPRRHMVKVLARVVMVGAVLALFLAKPVSERLTASNAGNLDVRFELNWIAVAMVRAHPVSGVGLSNFIPVMPQYDSTNVMRRFPATVHNVYLLEAAEAGLPGMLLFVALFGTIVIAGLRRLPAIVNPAEKWIAAAILSGLIGFLVTQLADFSHRLEPLRSLIWTHIGLLFALCAQRPRRSEAPFPRG